MLCPFNPNCSDFPKNCQWGRDIVDPDVAGIGVRPTLLCELSLSLISGITGGLGFRDHVSHYGTLRDADNVRRHPRPCLVS
jgi:hypothetical protein